MDGRHHDISQLDGKALVASSCWSFWCMMQTLLSRKTKELTKVLRGSSSQILANLSTAGYTPEVYGWPLGSWHTSPRTTCHDLRQWSRLLLLSPSLSKQINVWPEGCMMAHFCEVSYPIITISSIILNFTLYKQHNLHKFLSAADGPWAVATNIATTATTWCRQMLRRFWIMTQQSNSNTSSIRSGWSSAFISNHFWMSRKLTSSGYCVSGPRDPKIRRVPLIAFYEMMPGAGSYLTS